MKKFTNATIITTAMMALASPIQAEPAAMVGLAVNFGGGSEPELGVTAKVLSSDEKSEVVGVAGVSYFFTNGGHWGADAGIGYTFENSAVTLGYDFINRRPQFSAGWADIKSEGVTPEVC